MGGWNLYDLDVSGVWRGPGQPQTRARQYRLVLAIELVTMPVPFRNFSCAVSLAASEPGSNLQAHAPRRMVPPISSTPVSSRSL